jgi:hypothetical protein
MAEAVNLRRRPRTNPQKHILGYGNHVCWRLSKHQPLVHLEGLGKLKEIQ